MAIIAVGQGRRAAATTLLGAADRWRTEMGYPIPTRDRLAVNDALRVLGTDDTTPDAAWRSGQALGLDDAVTLALDAAHDPT